MNRAAIVAALIAFLVGLSVATFAELRIFLPSILKGAAITVQVSVLSISLLLVLSLVAGIGRSHGWPVLRWISAIVAALIAFLVGLSVATFAELRIFLPSILKGAVITVQVSILSITLFLVMSFVAGIGRSHGGPVLRWISVIYIEVFRGTSLLVILFWMFFVMPEFGVFLSPFVAGVLGIGLNFGAYGAEVVRGAISAVPKGQSETSIALNMSPYRSMMRIILPQAVAITIPGLTNLTIELIKATALVSAVTLSDITYAAVLQNQLHFRTVEIFGVTLILYYCFSQFVRFGGAALEDRFTRHLPKRI